MLLSDQADILIQRKKAADLLKRGSAAFHFLFLISRHYAYDFLQLKLQ